MLLHTGASSWGARSVNPFGWDPSRPAPWWRHRHVRAQKHTLVLHVAGLCYLETSSAAQASGILEMMTTTAAKRRHLASSPFQPDAEPTIEQYALNDLVSHDSYGMGRVINLEGAAVTVDFRSQTVRIPSPYHRMARL
jgi:hypothetical protein